MRLLTHARTSAAEAELAGARARAEDLAQDLSAVRARASAAEAELAGEASKPLYLYCFFLSKKTKQASKLSGAELAGARACGQDAAAAAEAKLAGARARAEDLEEELAAARARASEAEEELAGK